MASIKVHVDGPTKKTIETREMAEIKEFRAAISKAFDMPIERTQLMYDGQHLDDLMTLISYGIRDGETVLLHYAAYASDWSDESGGDANRADADADGRHKGGDSHRQRDAAAVPVEGGDGGDADVRHDADAARPAGIPDSATHSWSFLDI